MPTLLDPTVILSLSVIVYAGSLVLYKARPWALALIVLGDLVLCLVIRSYASQFGAASVALPLIFSLAVVLLPLAAFLLEGPVVVRPAGIRVFTDVVRLMGAAVLLLTLVFTRHPFLIFFLATAQVLVLLVTDAGPGRRVYAFIWAAIMFGVLFHFGAGSFAAARALPSSMSFRAWMACLWIVPAALTVFEKDLTGRDKGLLLVPIVVLAVSQLRMF